MQGLVSRPCTGNKSLVPTHEGACCRVSLIWSLIGLFSYVVRDTSLMNSSHEGTNTFEVPAIRFSDENVQFTQRYLSQSLLQGHVPWGQVIWGKSSGASSLGTIHLGQVPWGHVIWGKFPGLTLIDASTCGWVKLSACEHCLLSES